LKSQIDQNALAANICYGVAGGLALAAIIEIFFTDWNPEKIRPVVTPIAGPDKVGLNLVMKW